MKRVIKIGLFIAVILVVFITVTFYWNRANKIDLNSGSFHVSMYYYDNADFFPKSVETFKNIKPLAPSPHIFIVNQHILAAHLIAQQFALSADPKVKTVVLITQNNWNAGNAPIITSQYGWKTPLGNIQPASDLADRLINKKIASVEEGIFTTEHGITGIIPYVAHSFPNAAVVTLVIRDGTLNGLIDVLAKELSKLDLSTTAIIGTIDMSHYLPKYVADAHDRLTVQSIKEFDYDTLPRLDIDTVPTLRTIMEVAESAHEKKFVQTGGMNSADIVDDPHLISTTSYITGYFAPGDAENSTGTIHMLFVGDIMFDRAITEHADTNGTDSLFSNINRLFLGTHAVVGNLEGAITNKPSVSEKDYSILRFTFDPLYAALLKKLDFSALSLANNHALDFGKEGYDQTLNNLRASSIISFGSPLNDENLSTKISTQGKTICLVGYNDLFIPDATPAIKEIRNRRSECSYIVVFAHWGIEYQQTPTDRQIILAHSFIDSGADLVIGAHPHVVEPIEVYKNKAIFYSLGNFIFDQNFSFATEHGLAVNIEQNDSKTIFTLVPTTIKNNEVQIANTQDSEKALSLVVDKNLLSNDISSAILKTRQFTLWNNNSHNQ